MDLVQFRRMFLHQKRLRIGMPKKNYIFWYTKKESTLYQKIIDALPKIIDALPKKINSLPKKSTLYQILKHRYILKSKKQKQ